MAAEISHDQFSATDKTLIMDSEKQAMKHGDVDAALEFLNNEGATVVEVDEKTLVRKIDRRIVPLMCEPLSSRRVLSGAY